MAVQFANETSRTNSSTDRGTIEDGGRTIDRAGRNVCYYSLLLLLRVSGVESNIAVFVSIEKQQLNVYIFINNRYKNVGEKVEGEERVL